MSSETISLLTIPLFSAAIGYVTNWTGVWMLFNPLRFAGFRLPGLSAVSQILPRRIQQIPGIMVGGVGWQGIIPSRAAKMGSIAVDKGIAKLGTPGEFYDRVDPEGYLLHTPYPFAQVRIEAFNRRLRQERERRAGRARQIRETASC